MNDVDLNKILDFYVKENNMKDTKYYESNNTVSNGIFGSLMLAIAVDSEFKESKDISKVIRMLLLNGFDYVNPKYKYSNLKLGKQYKKELKEYHNYETEDSKIAFRYFLLDNSLTKLMEKSDSNTGYQELEDEAIEIFNLLGYNDHDKCAEIFRFFYLNSKLKHKVRSGWDEKHWNVKTNHKETIAEHVVETVALAIVLKSELNYDINFDKVIRTLAIHEIGETVIGDVTPFDNITPAKKMADEHEAMNTVLGKLTNKEQLLLDLYEFDDKKTDEAIVAHYIDKIVADLQAKLYQDKGLQHPLTEQQNNCAMNSSKVKEMIANGAKTAFDIWYGYDKTIYVNEKFPVFSNILDFANENDLLSLNDKSKKLQLK